MPGMEATPEGGHPAETGGQTINISPARQQLIGVRTAVIEQRELGTTVRTVGTLAYDETRVAQIHTKISGWVERVYVDYIGKDIRRDEPLLTVYTWPSGTRRSSAGARSPRPAPPPTASWPRRGTGSSSGTSPRSTSRSWSRAARSAAP